MGASTLADMAVGTSTPRFCRKRVYMRNWATTPAATRLTNAHATWSSVSGPNGTSLAGRMVPSIEMA